MLKTLTTALALVTLLATGALAETVFEATLGGNQEVPPNASPATGTATITLSDDQTSATYTVEFSGLEGDQTAAHFHQAPAGSNGGVVFALAVGSPIGGVWPLSASDVAALLAGEIYVNVHSTMFPGGEIRGQFVESSVTVEAGTWSTLKSLFE
ncbi:MAG: CHRD domain-containing protein [Candidatus Krumholzibacteriia bacterium]